MRKKDFRTRFVVCQQFTFKIRRFRFTAAQTEAREPMTSKEEHAKWPKFFTVVRTKQPTAIIQSFSPSKSPGRAVRLPENGLSHGTPGKVNFLKRFRIVPKIFKKQRFYEKMGGKNATNAILAYLRSKIFKIFRGSMPPDPLDRAKKFLPEKST